MSGRDPLPREQAYQGVKAVNPPDVISSNRAPKTSDTKYPLGTIWLDKPTQTFYGLAAAPGIWTVLGAGQEEDFTSISIAGPGPGNVALDVLTGDVQIATGDLGVSAGSIVAQGDIISLTGNLVSDLGDLVLSGPGSGIQIHGGAATDSIGSATLVAGTVTIANTSLSASDRIFLSRSAIGGTAGNLTYTIIAGTSFTITSSSGTDTSTVSYLIILET